MVALVMAVGLLSAVTVAVADPAAGPGDWLQRKLGLSDEQMTRIRELRPRDPETGKQLVQSFHQAQAELRQLALGGADAAAVQQKLTEVHDLQGRLLQRRVQFLQDLAPILTAEQREKLAQLQPGGSPGHGHHRRHAPRG
jgi:Spy/CpxP family protein refolding chaperone